MKRVLLVRHGNDFHIEQAVTHKAQRDLAAYRYFDFAVDQRFIGTGQNFFRKNEAGVGANIAKLRQCCKKCIGREDRI